MEENINNPTEGALPTKPVIIVKVTRSGLEAELQLQRTGTETADPLREDILAALAEKDIIQGINEEIIAELCAKPAYNRVYVIAHGKAPETGKDGYLKYLVQTQRELRPKIREDGTADFKDLGFVQNVLEGQPLCELYAPEKGEDGVDVHGNVLEGKLGRECQAPAGANTCYNEDKTMLLAEVSGNVDVKHGVISIIDVLKISDNVDNSTGDITFTGDVIIGGDVVSGFKVSSGGSIVVRGSVQGATLEAAGDINIGQSMNGMNRGVLTAGGSVKCKYIQSCYVKTSGNIYADTLMYCKIDCSGDVELSGKRGVLIGGHSSIAGKLSAKTIGTSSHMATEINMCATGTEKEQLIAHLVKEIKNTEAEITKMMQVLARYEDLAKKGVKLNAEQIQGVKAIKDSYLQHSQKRNDTQAQLDAIKKEQLEASQENSFVECKDRVHTGVRFSFGPVSMMITQSFVHSRIHVLDGSIKVSPL